MVPVQLLGGSAWSLGTKYSGLLARTEGEEQNVDGDGVDRPSILSNTRHVRGSRVPLSFTPRARFKGTLEQVTQGAAQRNEERQRTGSEVEKEGQAPKVPPGTSTVSNRPPEQAFHGLVPGNAGQLPSPERPAVAGTGIIGPYEHEDPSMIIGPFAARCASRPSGTAV